jgi:hypothetical protein
MKPWGKFGKEYYSWYIQNIEELESYIIHRNIDVDNNEAPFIPLQRQLTGTNRRLNDGDALMLRSPNDPPGKHYRFVWRAVVVF